MLILALVLQSTTCMDLGAGMTSCRTYGGDTAPVIVSPYTPGIMQSFRKPGKREKRAGDMIVAGDCDGAERYALAKGDFALASTVRSYCRMKPK